MNTVRAFAVLTGLAFSAANAGAAPSASIKAASDARHATRAANPEAAMQLARTSVLRDIKLHGNFSTKLDGPTISSVTLSDNSDGKTLKPITGYGTIHVEVKQSAQGKSLLQKLMHPFSKYADREFDVQIDAQGHAVVLNKGWSQTMVGKLGRALRSGPGRLISSIKQNPNAKKIVTGVAIAAGAAALGVATGGAATVGLLGMKLAVANLFGGTAIAAATKTVGIFQDGRSLVNKSLADRSTDFNSTVVWAEAQGKAGKFPSLEESYQHYMSQRPDQNVVRNYTLGGFAEALQSRDL